MNLDLFPILLQGCFNIQNQCNIIYFKNEAEKTYNHLTLKTLAYFILNIPNNPIIGKDIQYYKNHRQKIYV